MHHLDDIAKRLLRQPFDKLDVRSQKVARHVADRHHIARNLALPATIPLDRGQE